MRTLESPGLNRDWRGVPRSISSWEAQNSGLDPDQRVPQPLNSPGPHFSKACILPSGCALPLPESPQGERGKKTEEKRGIDYRGRKRKRQRREERGHTGVGDRGDREGRSRADLGQGEIERGQAKHPTGAPRAELRGGEPRGRAGHVPRDLLRV